MLTFHHDQLQGGNGGNGGNGGKRPTPRVGGTSRRGGPVRRAGERRVRSSIGVGGQVAWSVGHRSSRPARASRPSAAHRPAATSPGLRFGRKPLGYGVIGNTRDSDSLILGSSPSTPASPMYPSWWWIDDGAAPGGRSCNISRRTQAGIAGSRVFVSLEFLSHEFLGPRRLAA